MLEVKNVTDRVLTLALSLGLAAAATLPGWAAEFTLTDADVVNAIEKAKILAPSIRLNARVSKEEVMVATYKNPKAEDKDCKIEAVLIAKEVMDLAPGEVPRVTVYFYSSSTLQNFKQVEVTAGDVKAFASGSLSKDELMASIRVKDGSLVDPRARIQEHLQESVSHVKAKVQSTLKGNEVHLTTNIDHNMSERSVKFEAVRMAEDVFEAAPPEVKKVVVIFEDRFERKENQVFSFSRDELKTLSDALDATLKDLKAELVKFPGFVPGSKLDLATVEIKNGPLKEERQKLLDRLKKLAEAGVGVPTIVTDSLMDIEDKVDSDAEPILQDKIKKLGEMVGKFEENLKGAKEHKAVAPSGGSKPAGAAPAPSGGGITLPLGGSDDAIKKVVLSNPDAYIDQMAREYIKVSPVTGQVVGKYKTVEEVPNFRRNLQFTIDALKGAGRGAEAEKFQKRLDDIKAKYGG